MDGGSGWPFDVKGVILFDFDVGPLIGCSQPMRNNP